jgi:hypothetical protein
MSHTILTSNPTALIPQPGRAVNTFPSGLVRVDQTYLGLTSQSATHRATLAVGNDMPDGDSSPCIDGLKIFPEVQERRREDGFTEYIVSAYGRSKSTYLEKSNFEYVNATIFITDNRGTELRNTRPGLFERVTLTKTMLASEIPLASLPNSYTPKVFVFASNDEAAKLGVSAGTGVLVPAAYTSEQIPFSLGGGYITKGYVLFNEPQVQEVNFGFFKETILSVLIRFDLYEHTQYT